MNPRTALRRRGSARAPARWFQYRSTIPSSSKTRSWVPPDRAPWGTNQRRPLARNRVLLALLLGRDPCVDRRNPHYRTPLCAPSDGPLPSGHQEYRRPGRAWTRAGDQTSASDADVVKITTGMLFSPGLCLISSRTSRPSFFGRFRSSKIRSGRGTLECFPSRFRKSIASAPSRRHVQVDMHLGVLERFPCEPDIAGTVFYQKDFDRNCFRSNVFIISQFFLAKRSRMSSPFRVATRPRSCHPAAPKLSCK
jgi:hypothetical protein